MAVEVIVSLVSGTVAVICCLISSFIASSKAISYIEKTQAVTDTKLEELTREVRRHNNFAQRMPVVEEQVKVINHRLNNLEKNTGR
jgi:hypothetical protein